MLFVYMSVDMCHFLSVFVYVKLVLTSVNLWMLHVCVCVCDKVHMYGYLFSECKSSI